MTCAADLPSKLGLVFWWNDCLFNFVHCRFDDTQQSMALVALVHFSPLEKATWGAGASLAWT